MIRLPLLCRPLKLALSVVLIAQIVPDARAQDSVTAQSVVIQAENVRYDYAQVLRVTPVYQTLTATRTEEECDPPDSSGESDSRLSRMVGAVRDALSRDSRDDKGESKDGDKDKDEPVDCRPVTVEREFQRPIAYDVDYLYKGAKYRSRLVEDPGNRLRIRVSITPVVPTTTGD